MNGHDFDPIHKYLRVVLCYVAVDLLFVFPASRILAISFKEFGENISLKRSHAVRLRHCVVIRLSNPLFYALATNS